MKWTTEQKAAIDTRNCKLLVAAGAGSGKTAVLVQRIINKILSQNGITYNDFIIQFGKTKNVRSDKDKYDLYVCRFVEISNKLGHTLSQNELKNNEYSY